MKQYLLVTLMNVQLNYEGAKLNKNKSEEEEMAEEKQEEEKVDCKKKYNVEYVPTILYFSNHKLKDTLIGQQPYDKLEDFVKGKQQ